MPLPSLTYEMRGPRGVRHAVTNFLRANLPRHIEACREAWDLLDEELPIPASHPDDPRKDAYFEREPAAIDRWPMIAVTTGRRTQRETDRDPDDGSPVARATYQLRVYSWVRAEGWDETQDMRDDLATAVQVCLLSHVTLDSIDGRLQIAPSTLTVDPSDVVKVQGDRYVAGSFVGVELHAVETLTDRLSLPGAQPRDTVQTVIVDGEVLPAHPALL